MANAKYFHWALVVTNPRTGMIYPNTNRGGPYAFHTNHHAHLLNSTSLRALIRISSVSLLNREFHQRIADRIRTVPVVGLTCRPWLWKAIQLLAEEGLLGFNSNRPGFFTDLENECLLAISRGRQKKVVMIKSECDGSTS
ncbi:hypothetical protein ACJ73_07712 [Blastomyces percursus]|uniref:Uncharacterized protein n=1 Tax=Blastomyces percursus TaxID=1658174 RepID=A0A1J9PXA9_9EURO|nr:hypothetical protein ACJ73_07712 [Blastomyces percursus]